MRRTVIGSIFISFLACLFVGALPATEDVFEAARSGDAARVKALLAADPKLANLKDESGRTPLHYAAIYGRPEAATALIGSGADIDIRDGYGTTPLRYALDNVEPALVGLLVAAGAKVPASGEEGREILHQAAWIGCGDLLDRMAKAGADLRSANNNGGTLLHSVVHGRLAGWTGKLLDAGFDPNARDRYSLTPLDLAAIGGRDELVRVLLDKGADIRARTVEGKNAYHLALESGQTGTAELLRSRGADCGEPAFPVLRGEYFGQKPPGGTAEIFAPGMVSTMDWEHGGPVLSPDGNEIYWSAVVYGASRGRVMFSRRVNGQWTRPEPAPFTKDEYREMSPGFSTDGRRIYFTSYRPIPEDPQGPRTYRLWCSERTGSGWSEPRPLPAPVNEGAGTARPTLAAGDVLYFGSWRTGRNAIYRSERLAGAWSKPEPLPFNDASILICSYVSPDDRYLIFESTRPGGLGGFDLYVAFRSKDGTWGQPVNLGDKVNSPAQEWFASMSQDGKFLFFTSNRNGNDDVYWIDVRAVVALRAGARP